jgi:hypothetical protein
LENAIKEFENAESHPHKTKNAIKELENVVWLLVVLAAVL